MWDWEFLLLYNINGMSADRIAKMNIKERKWWYERLQRQRNEEKNVVDNVNKGK